jgi:hypothetical protein
MAFIAHPITALVAALVIAGISVSGMLSMMVSRVLFILAV